MISARQIMEMDDNEFNRDIARPVNLVFETWKAESRRIDTGD